MLRFWPSFSSVRELPPSFLLSIFPCLGGDCLQERGLAMFRDQVADIIFGTMFLSGGLAACAIAAMRRGNSVRSLMWLGIWSAMYGALHLADSLAVVAQAPHWFQVSVPYVDTVISYLILVVASLAFLELTLRFSPRSTGRRHSLPIPASGSSGCALPFPSDRQWPSVLHAVECGRNLAQLPHAAVGHTQVRRPEVLDHVFPSSARRRESATVSATVQR
jgi:hypothetical protein